MNLPNDLLLDTHSFIWYVRDDPRLPLAVIEAIENPQNTIYVSIVSLWEIALKNSLGKLALELPLEDFFAENVDNNGFRTLGISRRHLLRVHGLPFHHRDPFDRLLIAQSIAEGMAFVSGDREVQKYPVTLIW